MISTLRVACFAAASRLVMWVLCIISDSLITNFDTSSTLITPEAPVDMAISKLFGMWTHWDAVFFLEIAEHGYRWDKFYAFFPGYPLVVRAIASGVLHPLASTMSYRSLLILSGALVSNGSFVIAAVFFYRLSCKVLVNRRMAYHSALLFCVNPAGIFSSALYSESLFNAASLGGLFALSHGQHVVSTLAFVLACATRSNGITYAGYFLYQLLQTFRIHHQELKSWRSHVAQLCVQVVTCSGSVVALSMPYIVHNWQGYNDFCEERRAPQRPLWCNASLPNIYKHCQLAYWQVGFFKYFQISQTPNFILAAPICFLALGSIVHYVRADPIRFISIEFSRGTPKAKLPIDDFSHDAAGVYVYHLFGLLIITVPFIHIQVLTRFLSGMPPVYWYASYLISRGSWPRYLVLAYFCLFNFLGVLLFTNFLPWT